MNINTKRPRTLREAAMGDLLIQGSLLTVAMSIANAATAAADPSEPVSKTFDALETIEVFGERGALYKARRSGDERHFADLDETPQTMTILTQTQLRDSGQTDLKEILASQAGITLGTGENGNAFGDRYVIRGHEARSDVFVDGVRDPGMTTRESFATEQIEITKGPSSTFAGRGSTGGAVNSITKQATLEQDFVLIDTGIGSDSYGRVTIDGNKILDDKMAVRANLLYADESVPGRDPATRKRQGMLVSGLYEWSDNTSLTIDGYYLQANDKPDLGSYFDQATRKPVTNIPVYLQDNDFLKTRVNTLTARLTHHFSDNLRLQNSMRYGTTDNGYVTTGAHGAIRDATDSNAPRAPTMTLSGHQGWQKVDYFVNQLNLFWTTSIADMDHQMVAGMEYANERVVNGTYTLAETAATNCILPGRPPRGAPAGADAPPSAGYCALNGDGRAVENIEHLLGRTISRNSYDSDFRVKTVSAYLMDTVWFNDSLSGFFGVRYDRFDYQNDVLQRGGGGFLAYDYGDGFYNGHAGVVYKITEDGNIYATYSTATNINGGESDVGGSCGYGGLCGTPDQVKLSNPEHTDNLELGTKWNLANDRLLLTAALFRTTKGDVMESVGDAYSTIGTLNTGRNRVEGVELSVTGNITERISVQASVALMDSEVLQAFDAVYEGLALSNFADKSAYLQLRYQLTSRLAVGGAWTYQSEMYGGQPDTAAGWNPVISDYQIVVPSYDRIDLFASYDFSDKLSLMVNVGNVTDETYWLAAYRSGSFMYLGDARSYRATLSWNL